MNMLSNNIMVISSCNDKRHKTFPSPDNRPVRLAAYRNNYIKLDINIKSYIIMPMKEVHFVGSSLDDLKNFPAGARREAGFELSNVQSGLHSRATGSR